MDNLMLKLNSLEEKEKKFYYQEMVFDQELNSKENPGKELSSRELKFSASITFLLSLN